MVDIRFQEFSVSIVSGGTLYGRYRLETPFVESVFICCLQTAKSERKCCLQTANDYLCIS